MAAFGQQGFAQYKPGQAQPQQQSFGTPYGQQQSPQQGGNFAAYTPQPSASLPIAHQIQQQQTDARMASIDQRAAEVAQKRQEKRQEKRQAPAMQPGAPGMMGFQQPPGLSPTGGGQPGLGMFAGMGPAGFNPFGNIPPFQFTGMDFMGNYFDNPGAMTAQQGAVAQALNDQRSQQIGNMFSNGTPLSPLNPALAYQQGQQMLGGGFQNPFAAPGIAQPMQQPSFGTPYNPQQDFQFTPPPAAQMARPGQDGAQQGYQGMQQPAPYQDEAGWKKWAEEHHRLSGYARDYSIQPGRDYYVPWEDNPSNPEVQRKNLEMIRKMASRSPDPARVSAAQAPFQPKPTAQPIFVPRDPRKPNSFGVTIHPGQPGYAEAQAGNMAAAWRASNA